MFRSELFCGREPRTRPFVFICLFVCLRQLFIMLGNDRSNDFWGARLSLSEELDCDASPEQRREFITQKYREGRYRLPHPAFSSQEELLKVWPTRGALKLTTGLPEHSKPQDLFQYLVQIFQKYLNNVFQINIIITSFLFTPCRCWQPPGDFRCSSFTQDQQLWGQNARFLCWRDKVSL